jgi:hypothetical protein
MDTYSTDPGNTVSGMDPGAAPQVRVGGLAGPAAAGQVDTSVNEATAKALFTLGADSLAPHIKEAATQQFMQGVEKASQGEALKDIVENRPWYTEIFGPSSAVAGARAYNVATHVAQFGADMERQMPTLAKEGPQAITAAMQASMKSQLTGDAVADMQITSAYVDQMAPLYKRHAKEHYVYMQKQASTAQVNAWSALGSAYQQRAASANDPTGTTTKTDVQTEAQRFLGALGPFADQTDDSYEKNMTHFLGASATAGNFHVVQLFKDNGLYDKLPPESRAQLDGVFRQAGRRTLDNNMNQFGLDVAMIVNDTAQDPRGLPARLAKLNAKAAAITGIPESMAQLVPNGSIDNITGHILNAQAAAANAGEKASAQAAIAAAVIDQPGGADKALAVGITNSESIERAVMDRWNATPDPKARAELLNKHVTGVYKFAKSDLFAALKTEENTKGSEVALATWNSMDDNARGRYFDADQLRFMESYSRSVKSGSSPEAAFLTAKVQQPNSRYVLDDNEKNASAKQIRAWTESQNENFLGWNKITDDGLAALQTLVGRDYARNRNMYDLNTSVSRSLASVMANGDAAIVGKHVILNSAKDQTPLTSLMMRGSDVLGAKETAAAFEQAQDDKAKALGVDLKNYTITRTPDIGGQARFITQVVAKDGRVIEWSVTDGDIRAAGKATIRVPGKAYTGNLPTQTSDEQGNVIN